MFNYYYVKDVPALSFLKKLVKDYTHILYKGCLFRLSPDNPFPLREERINGVAIKTDSGYHSLGPGYRHGHIMIMKFNDGKDNHNEQGFCTDHGFFLTRKEAYKFARANGQFKRKERPFRYNGKELYSEDLWDVCEDAKRLEENHDGPVPKERLSVREKRISRMKNEPTRIDELPAGAVFWTKGGFIPRVLLSIEYSDVSGKEAWKYSIRKLYSFALGGAFLCTTHRSDEIVYPTGDMLESYFPKEWWPAKPTEMINIRNTLRRPKIRNPSIKS